MPPLPSPLAVGARFEAFDVVDSESGEASCLVCGFTGRPKILAAGVLGDGPFGEDLKNIDAIVAKYGGDAVAAFAVVGVTRDGELVTPVEDQAALLARTREWRKQLDISLPVGLAATAGWQTRYGVTANRTLMLADRADQVRYFAVAPGDLAALDAAIRAAVGG